MSSIHRLGPYRRGVTLGTTLGLLTIIPVEAAHLQPETIAAWDAYVHAIEHRRAQELGQHDRFLTMDFTAEGPADRRAVLAGAIVVRQGEPAMRDGIEVDVPSARVHHWRGAIWLPGVGLSALMTELQSTAPPPDEDVLQSRLISRGVDSMTIYLRLQRTKFVTVIYDTEHVVTFSRDSGSRASSASVATRIAELSDPGTPGERALPPGDDRGFLWRLNAYWRYEATADGVIAECESIALGRDLPFGLHTLAAPLVETAARESMTRTLLALRDRVVR